VYGNFVKDNGSVGILVIRLAPEHAQKDPEMEPMEDRTRVEFNYVLGNGLWPHPYIAEKFQGRGGDLGWDGTGERNCADLSDAAVLVGPALPACAPEQAKPGASPMAHAAQARGDVPAPATLPDGAAARLTLPDPRRRLQLHLHEARNVRVPLPAASRSSADARCNDHGDRMSSPLDALSIRDCEAAR
jgi:hypothetical protein